MSYSEKVHMLCLRLDNAVSMQKEAHDKALQLMVELNTLRTASEKIAEIYSTSAPKYLEFWKENQETIDTISVMLRENTQKTILAIADALKEEKSAIVCQSETREELEKAESEENARRQAEVEKKAAEEKASLAEKVAEIKALREKCEKYQLENREILARFTDEELARIYNGIGPSSFPDWLRDVLDARHPSLDCVALIHDVENELSDGTKASFKTSNRRFRKNGNKVAKTEFKWNNPRRYAVMLNAATYAWICQTFGWKYREQQANTKKD